MDENTFQVRANRIFIKKLLRLWDEVQALPPEEAWQRIARTDAWMRLVFDQPLPRFLRFHRELWDMWRKNMLEWINLGWWKS